MLSALFDYLTALSPLNFERVFRCPSFFVLGLFINHFIGTDTVAFRTTFVELTSKSVAA